MSFGNNQELIKKLFDSTAKQRKFIVFYDPKLKSVADRLSDYGIKTIPFQNNLRFVFNWLPIIMSGKLIFCDNYFPFLGGMYHPKGMRIVQLWHANGAIKRFGWGDPKTKQRSLADQKRFQAVYDHFDDYVVASRAMGEVFADSYNVDFNHMKLLGYPRSDHFLDSNWQVKTRRYLYKEAPELKNRRIILYAPTYREGVTFDPPQFISQALSADPNAIAIIKLHPLLKAKEQELKANAGDNSKIYFYNQFSTDDLLTITDTLVTDYSSVAFDFSLLPNAQSLWFYMFDFNEYDDHPGVQKDIFNHLPSRPIFEVAELAKVIKENPKMDLKSFNQYWNSYNDGHASDRVIKHYINLLK